MAKKIEIFENTLLKLLVRRGIDADRRNIILSEGELGYTTDTKRLYIGDGQTLGGNIVANNNLVSTNDITTLPSVAEGDVAFSTNTKKLYRYKGPGPSTVIDNWEIIGGSYTPGNGTINISTNNQVTVNKLSAGVFDPAGLGNSITLDGSNRISLSPNIAVDSITITGSNGLSLPAEFKIGNQSYEWPNGGVENGYYLATDATGQFTWKEAVPSTSVVVAGSAGQVPVGTIMPFISAANAPSGWLLCNGQSVLGADYRALSAVIGTTYGGNLTSFNVPDFTNTVLYGVQDSPGASTKYNLNTGTSTISATGVLYIIKARPDSVFTSFIKFNSPLSATRDSVDITDSTVSYLSGNFNLSLTTTLESASTFFGGITVDEYGRVTGRPSIPAGTKAILAPGTRPAYNATSSSIAFFETPCTVVNSYTATTGINFTISAYPYITDKDGVVVNGGGVYSVPPEAKNLIIDCWNANSDMFKGTDLRIVCSAPNTSLLNPTASQAVGSTEFLINAIGGHSRVTSQQATIPLSATSTGVLITALRISNTNQTTNSVTIRVIGYTL